MRTSSSSAGGPPQIPDSPLKSQRQNVLSLRGEIDLHVLPAVTESLNTIIEKKPDRIVIDLSRVTYIDGAGMATLIQAMQKVKAYGGEFLLAGPRETRRSIFGTSGLDNIFRIFPDVDAALAAIQPSEKKETPR